MSKRSDAYLPLNTSEDDVYRHNVKPSRSLPRTILVVGAILSLALNVVIVGVALSRRGPSNPIFPQILYSPAQDVLSYKVVKFHSAFGASLPIYDKPPSPEVDAAWDALYEFAYIKVPKSQAAQMTNKTYPVLGDETNYMASLDVFHMLHCLNQMRKAMYPEYYPPSPEGIHTSHMRHCISSLRQSLMCSADISTIVWQWSETAQAAKERSDVVHTCRDFDAIRDWAKDHYLDHQQDMTVYIPDDLDIPTF